MKKPPEKWNKTELLALIPPLKGRDVYHDPECRNLILTVTPTGAKIFSRYGRVNGKPVRIRIGTFPEWSVANARTKCQVLTGEIAQGNNPAIAHRVRRNDKTIEEVWLSYLEIYAKIHKRSWRRDVARWEHHFGPISKCKLSALTYHGVSAWHRDIGLKSERNSKGRLIGGKQAANLAFKLLLSLYNYAIRNEWIAERPFKWVQLFEAEKNERYLKADEAPAFFKNLEDLSPNAKTFVMLCLMTGARRGNVCAMEWSEIDWSSAVWTVPAAKSKTRRALTIPLSQAAIDLLDSRKGNDSKWVLPSKKSRTGHMTVVKCFWKDLLTKSKIAGLKIHHLRHTVASWQANRGTSKEIIGKTLTHSGNSMATIDYSHLDIDAARTSLEATFQAILEASGK